jgi:hypothetical protein
MGALRIISVVGVSTIGTLGMIITWGMCTAVSPFNDPKSSNYVQDPLIIAFLAFGLCGSIGYSFTMLFDHTADVILYCYAFNKRFDPSTCEKFVPEELRLVVGIDDRDHHNLRRYGTALPHMYLSTFMETGNKDLNVDYPPVYIDKWGRPRSGGNSRGGSLLGGNSREGSIPSRNS